MYMYALPVTACGCSLLQLDVYLDSSPACWWWMRKARGCQYPCMDIGAATAAAAGPEVSSQGEHSSKQTDTSQFPPYDAMQFRCWTSMAVAGTCNHSAAAPPGSLAATAEATACIMHTDRSSCAPKCMDGRLQIASAAR